MEVLYKSTRKDSQAISSSEAIIRGISEDGGLYVPTDIPNLSKDLEELSRFDYKELAVKILSVFFTDFTIDELKKCVNSAYDNKFDNSEIAPVKKIGDQYFLELFHGPTIAFKDMALSILPHLLKTAMKKQDLRKEIVILTATSGDTGKAALQGFNNIGGIKVIVFFPENGVSKIQKLQMRTHQGNNVYVFGIDGNFDDAQSGVKKIFVNKQIREALEKKNYMFSSANSINIGRLIPQIVYYFYGYFRMIKASYIDFGEKINLVVPTGNFGNILAGYYAKKMGLPINKLICASNENRVLFDFLSTGKYDVNREFYTTSSPSMDILISSNLERLLYTLSGENQEEVKSMMEDLGKKGEYNISAAIKKNLRDFAGEYASEKDTNSAIDKVYKAYNYLLDPHTAVAYSAYEKYKLKNITEKEKYLIVSTASPYKFPADVLNALSFGSNKDEYAAIEKISFLSNTEIPLAVKDIMEKRIVHHGICDKNDMLKVVKETLKI